MKESSFQFLYFRNYICKFDAMHSSTSITMNQRSCEWYFKIDEWEDEDEDKLSELKCRFILWSYELNEEDVSLCGTLWFEKPRKAPSLFKHARWSTKPINVSREEIYAKAIVHISFGKIITNERWTVDHTHSESVESYKPKTDKRNPTDVTDDPWIYYWNEKYTHLPGGGKWMLFYDKPEIDEKWNLIKEYYDKGKLEGIHSMKVSTNYKNPRASADNAVIICYCGPSKDEENVMRYGRNLVKIMEYEKTGQRSCFFKDDDQTLEGTRATGSKNNHLYEITLRNTFYSHFI